MPASNKLNVNGYLPTRKKYNDLKFFDYVFFRLYKFYNSFSFGAFYEQPPIGLAIALLTFTQLLTIDLVAIGLENQGLIQRIKTSTWIDLIILGVVFLLNWYRYTKIKTVDKLLEQWGQENVKMKIAGAILTIIYIFGTLTSALYFTGFFKK